MQFDYIRFIEASIVSNSLILTKKRIKLAQTGVDPILCGLFFWFLAFSQFFLLNVISVGYLSECKIEQVTQFDSRNRFKNAIVSILLRFVLRFLVR